MLKFMAKRHWGTDVPSKLEVLDQFALILKRDLINQFYTRETRPFRTEQRKQN